MTMNLKVLLPFEVLIEKTNVLRVVVETQMGLFGLLPNRRDCVAALVPGILVYETETDGEVFMAVDDGILAKTGPNVTVSVRRALVGTDLSQLHDTVTSEFLALDERELRVRSVAAKLEAGLLRRFASFRNE